MSSSRTSPVFGWLSLKESRRCAVRGQFLVFVSEADMKRARSARALSSQDLSGRVVSKEDHRLSTECVQSP